MAGNLGRAIYDVEGEESGGKHIPSGGVNGQFLGYSEDGTAIWADLPDAAVTNLGYIPTANTGEVTSSTGLNATIPAATITEAGLMTATDKNTLDNIVIADVKDSIITIEAGEGLETGGDFTLNQALPETIVINHINTAGNKHIPSGGAVDQVLGYSSDGIAVWVTLPDAAVTNLGYTSNANIGTITSSTGTDATIPSATTRVAGLITGTDKTNLDALNSIVEW